jgi:membrane associated rhomboid family serine protease
MIVKPRRTQNTAKKKLFSSFLFLLSCLSAETGFPAFDVFTSSSQLGMGGAGFLNPSPISSKLNPSVADTGRYFSTSIIRYQAGITSQSAGMSLPWKKGFGVFSLRHISYGTFDGYDDDFQSTGTYQSGDTWLHGGYSKQLGTLPLSIGTAAQFYSSSLKDHQVRAFVISVGSDFYIHKFKAALGLSFHNIGKTFGGNNFAHGLIVPKTVISGSKKLIHLPLTLFLDTILSKDRNDPEFFLGGRVWTPITYMFLHGGLMHLFGNMLMLYFFGPEIERVLGSRQFLRFYLLCGGVGVMANFVPYFLIQGGGNVMVAGASGATLGVLVAFAMVEPDRRVFLFPIPIPVTSKILVFFIIAMNMISAANGGSGVSIATHLGGMAVGYAYMKWRPAFLRAQWHRRGRKIQKAEQADEEKMAEAIDNIFDFKNRNR